MIKSKEARCFTVLNQHKNKVIARINLDCEELELSWPQSQVIDTGETAGFDIVFMPSKLGVFKKNIQYEINNVRFCFQVNAFVEPVVVELSREVLKFSFSEDSMEDNVTERVVLTNKGNSEAKYEWNASDNFSVEPVRGVLEPYSSFTCLVLFAPKTS